MADPILCPKCGADIAAALVNQVRSGLQAEADVKQRALTVREEALQAREHQTAKKEEEVARVVREQVQAGLVKARDQALKEVRAAMAIERDAERGELERACKERDEAKKAELALRLERKDFERQKAEFDLTLERRLAEGRSEVEVAARKAAAEEYELKIRETESEKAANLKTIADLKRRLEQGSQQLQGEVLESWLEEMLRREFPHDDIEAIAKGVHGADVLQRVRGPRGAECGVILWESKRTKGWDKKWLPKLREDQREAKAEIAALISVTLPPDTAPVSLLDGVWVANYPCGVGLAYALRKCLMDVAGMRASQSGRESKEAVLYAYMTGTDFRNRVQGLLEPYLAMRAELAKERVAMEGYWGRRDKQIDRAIKALGGLYGEVGGILDGALPTLPALDQPALEDGRRNGQESGT